MSPASRKKSSAPKPALPKPRPAARKQTPMGNPRFASANASLDRVVQDLFSLERELQILDTQIERYNARSIIATFDGIILKIEPDASQVGQAIKEGQMLATIVPDTVDPYAAIYIDGVDAPLIQPGPDGLLPRVRLQFEGWPAIQFGPAPNLSLGTFGGRIERIDPTNNEKGQFRVLIKPEPHFEYDDWPDREYLRHGNTVQGFVFLRLVPLWYEMWRRLNGFPPMPPPLKSDKASKPPKVKV